MIKFQPSQYLKQERPAIQMTSMIDIMFINLLFFMALFVYFNFETELNISVPKAGSSLESRIAPEEIVVNVDKAGDIVVNRQKLNAGQLAALLKKTSSLYPSQAVIIRADQKTYHESVVNVLDAAAKAKIWNISFATTKDT